ncbi:MAG: RNA polymerase sigma factor [Myxococcales bacterium]
MACIPRLRRYARALLGERASADDLVQATLERAWQKMALWRRGPDMRSWLFGIMHNLHVDQLRKPSLSMTTLEDDEADLPVRASQGDGLELRDLDGPLGQLPPAQREVLLLVALEDMTYDEVARTLDIPPGTVMSRLSRGRASLRVLLEARAQATELKVVK